MKHALVITVLIFLTLALSFNLGINGASVAKDKCKHISGIVIGIFDDGSKDAVLKIEGQKSLFYINHGFEKKFSLKTLLNKLQGKQVSILYADTRNPLGSIFESRHISEISLEEELLYSEFTSNK
jgi:hypothetical protein